MTSEELAAAAASFRDMLPLPDQSELRSQLAQPILHDLVTILKRCCPETHPLTTAKKVAAMFFMAAVTDGELERLKTYDTLSEERRAQILAAWEGVLAAMEPEQQPRFQYLAILRYADAASGARTFDRAVVAFDDFARALAKLDERTESDERDVVKDVHYALYAQPDDLSHCQAVLTERLPDWALTESCDREGFQFLQFHHRTTGAQLDINVGHHWFAIASGLSAGPFSGGGWRDEMIAVLVDAARRVHPEAQ